jgi:putative membrane protein
MQAADDLGGMDRVADWISEAVGAGAELGVGGAITAVLIVTVVFVVTGWVSSIVATVARFHGFTLTVEGDDLKREYGLFSRHRSTIPLQRVQAVRIEESLLRRPFGLAALKIETAGAGPQPRGNQPGGGAEAFVPIARRPDVGRLLAEVFEDARFDGVAMSPVAPVSRRRGFVRLAIPVVLAAAGLGLVVDPSWAWLGLLLLPAWLAAGAQYRARGWARPPGYALVRNGVLTRTSWVVPERKIQTLHLRESPFQRRWGLGTLFIDTAARGRAARVVDLDRDMGAALLAEMARDAKTARRAEVSRSRDG